MNKNLKIGLIGAGAWGKNHLRVLSELGLLAGVADANTERLAQIQSSHPGIQTTTNYQELLASPTLDAVCIATPACTHAQIAHDAITAGKHVFVEKPLTLNKHEGETLVKYARENKKILMVGHLLHYHPAIIELKKIVTAGTLGNLRYIATHRLNTGKIRTEENVLWSFAPHDISLILSFFGALPSAVTVSTSAFINPKIADIGTLHLSFPENKSAHIYTSWLNPFKEHKFVVIGEKAMAVFDDRSAEKLTIHETPITIDERGAATITETKKTVIDLPTQEPLANEWQHFVDCVTNNKTPLTDGEEGVRVLSVLEQL